MTGEGLFCQVVGKLVLQKPGIWWNTYLRDFYEGNGHIVRRVQGVNPDRLAWFSMARQLFSFPNPVNEKAARVVAGVVLVISICTLATGAYWLLIPLAYGFWARVLTGPTLSPLGWVAQNRVAPRLGERKPVPGPPKRFAQGMGAVMSTAALILGLILGHHLAADALLGLLIVASGLESIFGYCLGCKIFGLLMRAGLVPDDVCAECADITPRLRAAQS